MARAMIAAEVVGLGVGPEARDVILKASQEGMVVEEDRIDGI